MKLVSFSSGGDAAIRFGALLDSQRVLDFCADSAGIPRPKNELGWFDLEQSSLIEATALVRSLADAPGRLAELQAQGAILARSDVRLHAPVPRPGKVICIGLNYRDHAEESGMELPELPLFFSKFPTSITAHETAVRIPPGSVEVDYEAELAVVIGRTATRVTKETAFEHVLGYANFNDVSARDFQFRDGQWQRGKSCDTFAPFGPFLRTRDEVQKPQTLAIQLRLNGKTLQSSNTDQLIFGIAELVAFLSQSTTLEPGDVIATGTPPGVGFARKPPIYVKPGDRMEVEIEGLGILANPVTE